MEIYRELYQISKSLSEFTNKVRMLHDILKGDEPIPLEPNQTVRFDQPEDWEQEFDERFTGGSSFTVSPMYIKAYIRGLLAEQRLQDSIEPEEV